MLLLLSNPNYVVLKNWTDMDLRTGTQDKKVKYQTPKKNTSTKHTSATTTAASHDTADLVVFFSVQYRV